MFHPPSVALGLAALLALGACTDPAFVTDPNRTRDGAAVGAVLGAAAGLVAGDDDRRGQNAALGAALGAGIGAGVGNALDRQAARMREQVSDPRVQIVNTGEALVVTMPQDILFAVDSSDLQPGLIEDLRAVAFNLQEFPASIVEVVGHTDNTGSAAYNLDLSQRRAQSVANVLIAAGVRADRIDTVGRGDDQPRASNLTPEGRAQNRRVDIVIRPGTA